MSAHTSKVGSNAIRGAALSFSDDPFQNPVDECTVYESDALIVIRDGIVEQFGNAGELLKSLPDGVPVERYENSLILPGLIDCHVHYAQTEIIGAYGKQLIDWLNKYAFVAEQKFKDKDHAREVDRVFLREALRYDDFRCILYR